MDTADFKFKSIKKRPLRSKIAVDDEEDMDQSKKLEELKAYRTSKRRIFKGVNAVDLLTLSIQESAKVQPKHVAGLIKPLDLATTFSMETNRRDEDADMLKYIDEQLAKKKGLVKPCQGETKQELVDPDDLVFNSLREKLLKKEKPKSEEMLSTQMLSGIPEVDLGIEEKIRNIEATEAAKRKLLEKKMTQGSINRDTTLVPTNVASNYVQHNRFNVHNPDHNAKRAKMANKPVTNLVAEPVVQVGDEPKQGYFRSNSDQNKYKLKFPGKEKATDDYHFEKFKKQFRK